MHSGVDADDPEASYTVVSAPSVWMAASGAALCSDSPTQQSTIISFVSLAQLRSSGSISVLSAITTFPKHTRDELEDGRLGEGMLVIPSESLAVRHGAVVVVRLCRVRVLVGPVKSGLCLGGLCGGGVSEMTADGMNGRCGVVTMVMCLASSGKS